MIPPPPSSSSYPPSGKFTYDVFLSFRGTDTRTNFTDHLYTALIQKGIFTFRDDEELKRGESIGQNLLTAIEESRYVIVVFSPNYAESAWCLDEIVKVNDCRKAMGQVVLPVFYHVDPPEVRRQTGKQFGKAFEKHQERCIAEPNKVQRWKDSLFQVGNLSGWHLQDGYESEVIQAIVDKIFTELNQIISRSEGLVGMDSHLDEMLPYFDIGSFGCPDVGIIWICGMGGIGKTTIAQVVFKRLRAQFDGCSFLENVREVIIETQGAVRLQQQLLSDLLKGDVSVQNSVGGKDIINQRLRSKRVLIILDDVDKEKQLEVLWPRDRKSFGPGSRIIATSRDEHLVREDEGDKVYKVNPLTDAEALQFFSMNAYKKDELVGDESPKQSEEFSQKKKLSKDFLKYASGHPLAIKVLGQFLRGRGVTSWSSTLQGLNENPEKEIIDVLKVSFDGLRETEKKIFLDIACFFRGWDIDHVKRILKSSGHCPVAAIEVLVEKSMLTLFGKKLGMHDLIQDLGREIVRQECPEEPGKRSRLWIPKDIIRVLKRSKATDAVQSIYLQCAKKNDVVHSINDSFSNMDELRLLKIWNVKFSGNINYLSNELQYLEWHECPFDSFPSDFQPDKLVEVHMYFSRIKQLWGGKKGWSMLRRLDLSGSPFLMSTPDFTEVPDLEVLVLQHCTSLGEVHPSLGFLKKLSFLDMKNCKSIESLPPFTTLESLRKLRLSLCSKLKKFPEIEGNMKSLLELHLDRTSIEELPPSIERFTGLLVMDLTDCKNLLRLPNNIGCLTSLKSLSLTGCSKIDEIPKNLNGMKCLKELFIGRTSIRELYFIAGMKNLQRLSCQGCTCLVSESCKGLASLSSLIWLDLSDCNLMDGAFLNYFSRLISLTRLDLSGNLFERLPESISQLSKLKTLVLNNCRKLQLLPKKLPLSLLYVYAQDCTSLTDYPNQIKVLKSSESGMTIVNSRRSSAVGVAQSSATTSMLSFSIDEGEYTVTYEHAGGKQVDHSPPPQTPLFSISNSIYVLPTDEIPEWFTTISTRNPISILMPQNVANDNKWKGFAFCAIFAVKGHTALSVIEPDPDFCNYLYQVTLETDVMRLATEVLDCTGANRNLGSCSHLRVIFEISRLTFRWWWLIDSTEVRAIFETTNPSMVFQKCGVRLVYEQDVPLYSRIVNRTQLISLGKYEDYTSILDSGWLNQSLKWKKFIPPLEEESTLVARKNLESVLPRYIEGLNSYYASYKFNLRGRPAWFHNSWAVTTRSNFVADSFKLPQNLQKSKKWMGIAIYASLVEEVGQMVKEEENYQVVFTLQTCSDSCTTVSRELKHVRPLSEEHHQLLVFYIPRALLSEVLFTQTLATTMDLKIQIKTESPHVKVQRFGFRIVYGEDIQGFSDTIIRCMQREDSLKSYDKLVVQEWIRLLQLQGARLERMTERNSRTAQATFRNWDWSDPRPAVCLFERVEISEFKWFVPFINQGNSAEIQLPPNVFDNHNWLGFAVCVQFSRSSSSSEDVLFHRLDSDVAWHGLFDYTSHAIFKLLERPEDELHDATRFVYIPRTKVLSKMWRQCKLARITVWFSSPCAAVVHSCALRLLFKDDIEHLVETLAIASDETLISFSLLS